MIQEASLKSNIFSDKELLRKAQDNILKRNNSITNEINIVKIVNSVVSRFNECVYHFIKLHEYESRVLPTLKKSVDFAQSNYSHILKDGSTLIVELVPDNAEIITFEFDAFIRSLVSCLNILSKLFHAFFPNVGYKNFRKAFNHLSSRYDPEIYIIKYLKRDFESWISKIDDYRDLIEHGYAIRCRQNYHAKIKEDGSVSHVMALIPESMKGKFNSNDISVVDLCDSLLEKLNFLLVNIFLYGDLHEKHPNRI